MPKLLVLFQSRSHDVIALAEAAVDGARAVRFAEVDLRRLDAGDAASHPTAGDGAARAHRTLEHVDDIAAYDGVILALPAAAADAAGTLAETFGMLGGSLVDKVGSVVTPAAGEARNAVRWAALSAMGDNGMILVPAPAGNTETASESARRIGKRVAEVIGWVTHARSHHHHDPHQHGHHAHPH